MAAAAAAVVLTATSTSCSSAPKVAVSSWEQAAGVVFAPVAQQESLLAQQEQQWEAGTTPTATFTAQLATSQSVMDRAARAVTDLPAYPGQPEVDRMDRAALALYATVAQIQLAATELPGGALRTQVMLISDRVRELGDRTFDQGRVLTAQVLVPPGLPAGTQIDLPLEVPDWGAEGLAPGPPLAPDPPAGDKYPPTRQGVRPTQPRSRWQAQVAAAGVPAPALIVQAVSRATSAAAGDVADQLQRAATAVGGAPDPAVGDGREVSDRLRLKLLVEAEACRLRQAETNGAGSTLSSPA